jgi:hypothetical protein
MSSTIGKIIKNKRFVERLIEACGTAEPAQISRLLNISYQAAKNYLSGDRYPSTDKLLIIGERTEYSIHWLLTGNGKKFVDGDITVDTPRLPDGAEAFVRKVCVEVINETFGSQPRIVVLPPASLREEKVDEEVPSLSERSKDWRL